MEALSDVLSSKKWDLPTREPTLSIGLSFIFLAYFLHPRIESAYQRVRASRAWRAVQKHKRVDVTDYPMLKEAFGVRGKWDAARTVTVLLAAFSLGSWVLELSLEIYHVKGEAYLLTQPPPVFKYFQEDAESQGLTWQVLSPEEIDPGFDGNWLDLDNMAHNQAKSRYYVKDYREYAWSKKIDKYIDGEIVVASWDPDDKPGLSYGDGDTVTVEGIACTGPGDSDEDGSVMFGSGEWGRVLECGEGPKVDAQTEPSQPAIILTDSATRQVHVVVEEVGTHPSFLYSVWTAANASSVDLAYTFHISSTVRLAEAVVTGIVHGETTGGSCFGLLRAFSKGDDTEDTSANYPPELFQRAKPFGENPKMSKVDSLQDVETLEAGVLMNTNALVAFVCLLLLSLVGIGWTMCLKSSVEMDVYDRDELLRAISQQAQGEPNDPSARSKMRIYVQKEHGGELNVVISEADDDHNCCARFLLRRQPTPSVFPVPVADTVRHALDDHGGVPLPLGRPRMVLGGFRTGRGRAYPGPNSNFRYPASMASSVALSASPVPSNLPTPVFSVVGSAAGTPAPATRGPAMRSLGGLTGANISSPIPSIAAGSSAAVTPAPSNSGSAAVGTPARSNSGTAAGTPVAPLRSPRSPGFPPSVSGFWTGGGGGGGGGVAGRGPSVLFDSVNTFGDGDDGSGSSSGDGGDTDGDGDGDGNGSADTEMGGGALARSQASAFGGDAGGDVQIVVRPQAQLLVPPVFASDPGRPNARQGSGSVSHIGNSGAQRGGSAGDIMRGARPQMSAAFGGDNGGDVEMGNLELVRPQAHVLVPPVLASDPGRPSPRGRRSSARVGGSGAQRGGGAGYTKDDDALHVPSDRTTPPASAETSPSPPPPSSRGLTTVDTLGPAQLGPLTRA